MNDAITIGTLDGANIEICKYDNFTKHSDYYLHIADFESYNEAKYRISQGFSCRVDWTIRSLVNISRTEKFSSNRTVTEYADDLWGIKPA